jgi:hypothetical protein
MTPNAKELTATLHAAHPPKPDWVLEMVAAEGPDRMGIHLLDGSRRYGIAVTYLRGGPGDKDRWEVMYTAVLSLYETLLANNLSTSQLPSGDDEGSEVTFAGGAVCKVVVETQWSGNKVAPTYPL